MKLDIIITGPIAVNTYVLREDGASECVVIDPADAKKVNDFMAERKLTCSAVLLTHTHFDHILGVAQLQRQGARVYVGKEDADVLYKPSRRFAVIYDIEPCRADVELNGGDTINEAGLTFKVLATPGHTVGGVSYIMEKERVAFTGDTLFHLDVGRTDLAGGNAEQLYHSIKDGLFALEGDYVVFPGHEEASTLDEERRDNTYMKLGERKW